MALSRVISSPASLSSQTRRHDNDCVRPALIACTYQSSVDLQSAVAHSVSGAAVWNDLPAHVTAAPSLAVFRQRLKTFLLSRSYPDSHLIHKLYVLVFQIKDIDDDDDDNTFRTMLDKFWRKEPEVIASFRMKNLSSD